MRGKSGVNVMIDDLKTEWISTLF